MARPVHYFPDEEPEVDYVMTSLYPGGCNQCGRKDPTHIDCPDKPLSDWLGKDTK